MADKKQQGKCFLVGAGPGDLGLVTLRAKECIEQAEVIVYDYLCNPEMLQWAPESAETIFAGKKAGAHTLTQEEINALLVQKAARRETRRSAEGRRSVRLWSRRGRGAGARACRSPVRDRAGNHLGDCRTCLRRNSGDASREQFSRDVFHRTRRSRKVRKLDRFRGARETRRHAGHAHGCRADRSDQPGNAGAKECVPICRWR